MTKTGGTKRRSTPSPNQGHGNFVHNRKRQQKKRVKRVSWRDERIEGMSVSDMPEFTDPAILVVREMVKIRYTKEELIVLRESPFSKKKPDTFDVNDVPTSMLDPDRWNIDKKKSDAPTENGLRGDGPEHRRRPGDPRERLRKENDGIVLSPQRRSFNSGCFVPVRETSRSNRPHSPLGGKNEASHMSVREIQTSNTRRIGSGRILRLTCDFGDKSEQSDGDFGFSRSQQQRGGERDDKYDRRSFGRDFEITRDRESGGGGKEGGRRNGHFERRRISDNREQEEPEWFSGGPVSQNDTIELRGFDDADKPGAKKKVAPSRVKRAKDWSKKKSEPQTVVPEEKNEAKEPAGRSTPAPQSSAEPEAPQQQTKAAEPGTETAKEEENKANNKSGAEENDHSFNFDEILKCDTFPGLLSNGVGADGDNMQSRFSRWFKQESPEKAAESRRSSLQDDHHIIKDLLNDIQGETNVSIPGDSEAYFAPISPAGNTGGVIGGKRSGGAQSQPINIMEMLQRGKNQGEAAKQPAQFAGKILNLDELEAKMRQNADLNASMPQKHQQQKPDEEMTAAFKKLLAQAQTGGHAMISNGPINKTQPMSLLEVSIRLMFPKMLSHSQQQDEAARMGANPHLITGNQGMTGLHHHAADLTIKLQAQLQQKQQMDMLNKLINATTVHPQHMRASPLHEMGLQQSRELLNRPEAQAILQGLKRGEITTQHLYQQLANPALQPRHREMLVTILKMQGGAAATPAPGYGPSPRVLSPVPPPHHMFQQQQQLRVSPAAAQRLLRISYFGYKSEYPHAMHQRIPSPRELQVHTQNILQRALIKKKLEEQQENYRKKQELQRGQSPSAPSGSQGPAKSVSSPTPLAFTPTSVLRKMTAEKDEGKENKMSNDAKVPPGRPLTGMRPQPPQPQAQQQQQWNAPFSSMKQAGRPIVKANTNYPAQTAEQFFSQQQQRQQRMFPQQQQQPQVPQHKPSHFGSSAGPGGPQTQYNSQQYLSNQQSFAQQLTQQQLRAQHQHRPSNNTSQQQQQQQTGFQQQQPQQGGQQMGASWQQFFSSQQANRNSNLLGRGGMADSGDLSPTANQLARWFSPDLLERARGGELPSTAGLAQHALSLEEIERQTAPPVHN
ncbi:hypothetical protein NQ315_000166 [Exocentrus adspersus]|uniref:Eukaryotic translation initiation factor 4E transporter n=1 Tax=Exocentrus adspersus TaxID=1586481 RepID=A0AAV8VQM3_9CUCU|nr:hypothetical protein NQ315_000166 [Exocentrus adspersus]